MKTVFRTAENPADSETLGIYAGLPIRSQVMGERRFFRQFMVIRRFPDFRRLFVGESISMLGSSVSNVALPLTAVLLLGASPAEMGILGAIGFGPYLLLSLPAGVWIGRWSYLRTIVVADVLRFILYATIPALAILGALQIWHLYVVTLLTGTCSLFGTIATTSIVPDLVSRDSLLPANSVTAQSRAITDTGGNAVAGVLVQLLTAPIAIAIDAVSFGLAALCKRRIQVSRPQPATEAGMTRDILAGLREVFGHRLLRPLVISATLAALFGQAQAVILVLFLARDLRLTPSLIGLALAVGSVAAILAAFLATPVSARIGQGRGYILGDVLAALGGLAIAAVSGPLPLLLALLFIAQCVRAGAQPFYSINQVTIRQSIAAPEMLARVNSIWRFLVFGMLPLGSLIGGGLGGRIGLRATFVVTSLGILAAALLALWSPLRNLRELATPTGRLSTA